jgi:hypothetical protein
MLKKTIKEQFQNYSGFSYSFQKVKANMEFWNNHLLTPWSRVLLEKLTSSQLVKKLPAFNVTQRFITAFTSACHLSLS